MGYVNLRICRLLLLLLGICHNSIAQDDIVFSCEEEWTLFGTSCYKVFSVAMGWNDAERTCHNYGSRLVNIFGFTEHQMVADLATPVDQYWIGLTRQNLVDPDDADDLSASWSNLGGIPPSPASLHAGYWYVNQPDPEDGACVYVRQDGSYYYNGGWSMGSCLTPLPFVCESDAGLQGFYRCANGRYIQNTESFICDGEDDCGDYSDEVDCSSQCRRYIKAVTDDSGSLSSESPYSADTDCMWTIEAPVGSRVSIEFTRFSTEKDTDKVQIWAGGKTERSSELIGQLSGVLEPVDIPAFHSSNNFLLVKFHSDGTTHLTGFSFTWRTEPQYNAGIPAELKASEDSQTFQSPGYGSFVKTNQREAWIITVPLDRRVISLQVEDFDLPECAELQVFDGADFTSPLLYTLSTAESVQNVVSTGSELSVFYQTCPHFAGDETNYRGFNISYNIGCGGQVVANQGHVISPGYMAEQHYPNFQECNWLIMSASGDNITAIFRGEFVLQDSVDYLKIYNGKDNSGVPAYTLTGSAPLPSNISEGSELFLSFSTNSIINERGFYLEFSTDCPELDFNEENIVEPDDYSWELDAEVLVSCPPGYVFIQEEHFGESRVYMQCIMGEWNVRQTPQCEPIWCGQAPAIDNGYYNTSTGSQYNDTVSYACYAGYEISGSETITCSDNGNWTSPPECIASQCNSLDDVVNGMFDNLTAFGSVLEFKCDQGYELVGAPRLYCDGEWSHEAPTCIRLPCPIEVLALDFANGMLTPSANVSFGDPVEISCSRGYVLEETGGQTVMNVTCLADQTFGVIHRCIDDNECSRNNGGCDDICTNTIGSYKCSCEVGFIVDENNTSACIDIDECAEGGLGFRFCEANHSCENTPGSYVCSCNEGHTLYTGTEEDSYLLSFPLEGVKDPIGLYINHSCLLVECDVPSIPENARPLTTGTEFAYLDKAYFACDLGYTPTEVIETECLASGQWSLDPASITCEVANCELPDVMSLTYAPKDFDGVNRSVVYKSWLTAICQVYRPDDLEISRTCQYDITSNTYELYLDGSSAECPIIDCGEPTLPQNSKNVSMYDNTLYDSTFEIACEEQYEQKGSTNLTGSLAVCRADGNWDFGTFECYGVNCPDPGTEPGTIQIPYGTYELGNVVGYKCIRDGFTLNHTNNLTCVTESGNTNWDLMAPNCTDTTAPVISQSICGESVVTEYLTPPGFTIPTVLDNTGATEDSGIIFYLGSITNEEGLQIALAEDYVFNYTAEDFTGNSASVCSIEVTIRDRVAPTVTCPVSYIYYLANSSAQVELSLPEARASALADDNVGTQSLTYSPINRTITVEDLGIPFEVEVTAKDAAGNTASCSYMIAVQADECSDIVLDHPHNGGTICVETDDGYECVMSCDSGYYFYKESGSGELVDNLTFNCTAGGGFVLDKMPDCVSVTRAEFYFMIELEYDDGDNSSDCQESYSADIANKLPDVAKFIQSECQRALQKDSIGVDYVEDSIDLTYTNKIFANVSFKITPDNLRDSDYDTCVEVILPFFTSLLLDVNSNLKNIDSSRPSCPDLVAEKDYFELKQNIADDGSDVGDYVCASMGSKRVDAMDEHVCLPCPPGHYYDSELKACSECPLGQYQEGEGATSCTPCEDGTYTNSTGTRRKGDCRDTCAATPGFVSLGGNNLPPCVQCARDKYSNYTLDSNTCESCPQNTFTNIVGATSESDCMSLCEKGHYSSTGHEPCTACPKHFYNNDTGLTGCEECASDEVTLESGANDTSLCVDGDAELCTPEICSNGTCSVEYHHIMCECQTGYTGKRCDTKINYCASNPCFAGACRPVVGGFTCECPGNYSGDQCETDPDNCNPNPCDNEGMCFDEGNDFKCLCPLGYSGINCNTTEDICSQKPCGSNSKCKPITHRRRVCTCSEGWTGVDCEENIDDCASNPCLYGFTCTDGDNSYTCECDDDVDPDGLFSGDNCEERLSQCSVDRCGDTGDCYDDFRTNSYLCICNQGYQTGSVGELDDPWYNNVTDISVNSKCNKTDYCANLHPCINGACTSSLEGAECDCFPGYTGYRCQRNIDDCGDDPCGENGECFDEVNGYTCECDSGFTGNHCETNIDDCDPNLCEEHGTNQSEADNECRDLINDYECVCKPGYTGMNCETEIDECLSSPCLHSGVCEDLVNGYHCNCSSGWEGPTCENITDYCGSNKCENDAECRTVFGEYLCNCSYPYFGQYCEMKASTCRDANPCVNEMSFCEEDEETGVAECTCSDDFYGQGCQLFVDYCQQEGFCKHGGDCESTLDGYHCVCPWDFSGSRCEDSADDCSGITCANEGVCVDGVGEYFCQCPIGSEGPNCDRNTDADWDLYFYGSQHSGMAYTTYPFDLRDMKQLSIAFWVKFAEDGGEGVFFTLYGIGDRYLYSPKRPLLQVDESGVTVMFTEGGPVTETFGQHDINDGKWYFMTITWSQESGSLQVRVNSARVIQLDLDAMIEPCLGFVLLGAPLQEPFKSDLEPERGESFQGYISHVYLWDVALDYIPFLLDDTENMVRTDDLILDWSAMLYHTQNGVQVVPFSTAAIVTCDSGLTGENCDEELILPDKESPTFENCPEDVYFTVPEDKRFTSLDWTVPDFKDHTGTPMALIESSRILTPGRYPNAYVAYDSANNAAVCRFDIYVRSQDCECPGTSTVVSAACDVEVWPFRTYSLNCSDNDNQISVEIPNLFTCGPEGAFNVFQPQLPLEYPECSALTTSTVDVKIEVQYLGLENCAGLQQLDSFEIRIRAHIEALDEVWKIPNTNPSTGAFCMGQACEDVITLDTKCVDSGPNRRKKRATQDAYVTIYIPGMMDPIINAVTSESLSVEQVLLSDILDDEGLTFSDDIPNGDPDEPSLVVLVSPSCPNGSSLTDLGCVKCAVGSYYNSVTRTCIVCPVGQYQETAGQLNCTECPDNQTTQTTGSKSEDFCYDVCEAGSQMDTDTGSCEPCERGYYQPEEGQFFCYPCTADNTTAETGSRSNDDCYNYCDSGTELGTDGNCKECEIGYYRTALDHDKCQQCTNGKVTESPGAKAEDECTVANCTAGTKIVGDDCEVCSVGTYQSKPYQDQCDSCDVDKTTLEEGSESEEDCLFFCPVGKEEINSENCEPCAVGFYKNSSLPGEMCEECPPNMLTEDIGSESVDNCTVLACQPGRKANDDKSMCVPCERGTYQPEANQEECLPCEMGQSTREEGAQTDTLCEEFCPDGEQSMDDSDCEPCPRGYYRNVMEMGEFSQCQICPDEDFITEGTGAFLASNCTVRNCSSGSFLNITDECQLCPHGSYQPYRWQTMCEKCVGQRTTDEEGSVSEDQCRLECEVGYEDRGNGECEMCERGYYKDGVGAGDCSPCEEGMITEGIGATAEGDCSIAACEPGTYRDTSTNTCEPCPRGTYEDRRWQEENCQPCESDKTTLDEGADSSEQCVLNCGDGEGFDSDTQQCERCPQGYYRTQGVENLCEKCPEHLVTANDGALTDADCNLGNCTAGYYQDGVDCVACPRGQFQPLKWMKTCDTCPDGQITEGSGSEQSGECYDIPPPIVLIFPMRLNIAFSPQYKDINSVEYMNFVNQVIAAMLSVLQDFVTSFIGSLKVENISEGSVLVLFSGEFEDTSTAGVGGNFTSREELLRVLQSEINGGDLGNDSSLITDITFQAVAVQITEGLLLACDQGKAVDLTDGECKDCPVGYYQPYTGLVLCQSCPAGYITADVSTVMEEDCYHPDDCVSDINLCVDAGEGEMCDVDTQRCVCRSGWSGTHTNCTHKCDLEEDYCQHEGKCEGRGTDDVRCDCSDTNYEGELCQTRTEQPYYTNAIIGGAIGGGLGLLLLIILMAACCCGFRKESKTPVEEQKSMNAFSMPLYNPSAVAYNAPPPTGVIVRPASLYGGGGAGTTFTLPMITNDAQSLPGYLGAPGTSTFMYHDDMADEQRFQSF